jgi:hypothetical protein
LDKEGEDNGVGTTSVEVLRQGEVESIWSRKVNGCCRFKVNELKWLEM